MKSRMVLKREWLCRINMDQIEINEILYCGWLLLCAVVSMLDRGKQILCKVEEC